MIPSSARSTVRRARAKPFISFTAAEGAGEHCHVGAHTLFHQRVFGWLDETLQEMIAAVVRL
jgi:hypothetical protein